MYRVIWQYHSNAIGPWGSELLAAAPLPASANLFADLTLVGDPEPVFDRPALSLRAEALFLGLPGEADETLDLAGYHHAFAPDRAHAERDVDGFAKVIARPNGKSHRRRYRRSTRGRIDPDLVLAIAAGIKLGSVASLMSPTHLGEVNKRAAGSYFTPFLFSDRMKRLVRLLARFV
ncbi:MAG: hypothetical protein HC897_18705 [Thermoanaerobaculia bacterium]|nr:hypothetical protein [Thermoanaerobaculia bacterium]